MNEAEYVRLMELVHMVFVGSEKKRYLDEIKKMATNANMESADYIVTASERFKAKENHKEPIKNEPISAKPKIATIPGTLGVIFDSWLAHGYDGSNCNDDTHPDGQERAMEAMQGFNYRGKASPHPILRNQTKEWLLLSENEGRANYFDMLEGKYKRWFRNQNKRN